VLWHFFWHEFCDWYLELKKLRFQENSGLTAGWRNTLAAFETALRLLHPAMPFLTEELWQRLATDRTTRPASIALAGYPQYRRTPPTSEGRARNRHPAGNRHHGAHAAHGEQARSQAAARRRAVLARPALGSGPQRHAEAIQKLANVVLEFQSRSRSQGAGACAPPPSSTWCCTCPRLRKTRSASARQGARAARQEHRQLEAPVERREISRQGAPPTWSKACARSWPSTRRNSASSIQALE
jgi:isoleucyl-tRNA synthetase